MGARGPDARLVCARCGARRRPRPGQRARAARLAAGSGIAPTRDDRRSDGARDDQRRRGRPRWRSHRLHGVDTLAADQHPRDPDLRRADLRRRSGAACRRRQGLRAGAAGAAPALVARWPPSRVSRARRGAPAGVRGGGVGRCRYGSDPRPRGGDRLRVVTRRPAGRVSESRRGVAPRRGHAGRQPAAANAPLGAAPRRR